MMQGKLIRGVIGLAFGLVMLLIPISSGAQDGGILGGAKRGVQQGAGTVQKGVEKGAHETKEGAEAVGRGTKKVITGEDNNPDQSRMKGESQSQTESTQTESTQSQSTQTESKATRKRNLPKTAGELPLLALAGCLALAGAAASGLRRRREN